MRLPGPSAAARTIRANPVGKSRQYYPPWGARIPTHLNFGLFWLQHASTRHGWYPASERTARLSYLTEPLKEPKLGSWYSSSGCPRPLRPSPSPPCHWQRMHPSAPSCGHCRPRTHAPAIGTHSGTHWASPGSAVGPTEPNSGHPSTPCGMCMHDRGTPSRGHPRVRSPGPMIGTRTDNP